MQNKSYAQRRWAYLLLAAGAVFCLIVLLMACPMQAQAKSYAMPQVDIRATLEADGSLHVVEQRTFDFDGSFTCVWWDFGALGSGQELIPNSVSIGFPNLWDNVDASGASGAGGLLQEVPFDTQWRAAGGPGTTAYSFDVARDTIYVFFDVADTSMVVTLDYTVVHAADLYNDCAELYWQYLGAGWAQDSRNVTCSIALPADGKTAVPEQDVRAWGHGPLSGHVAFDDAGTTVLYDVGRVKAGEYAEARIVFPRDWLAAGSDYPQLHAYNQLDDIVREERAEAARANRGRMASLVFFGLLGLISAASIGWSAVKLVRDGIEHKPAFIDSYWRDVPNKDVHPATIGRLCRWDSKESSDVLATILHLANSGAIRINKAVKGADGTPLVQSSGQAASQKAGQENYYLQLNPSVANTLTNPIDTNLVGFLFGSIAPDCCGSSEGALWLSDIDAWAEKHKKSFYNKVNTWQNLVSHDVKKQGYFEEKGAANQESAWTLAIALVIVGVVLAFEVFDNLWPIAFFGITAVIVFLLAINMPRRTQKGADDYARAMGLKKWLKDFTALDERLPTDVKVWGEFMVYAQLFGVAKETISKLRTAVPELFAADPVQALAAESSAPWYSWYVSDGTRSSLDGSFSRSFDTMWTRTTGMAEAAHSVSVGSGGGGGWSSGGGGGGGFSGGGGGGFGGGGGGAR